MALKFNNTDIASSCTVKYNNTALKKIKFGSTQVWSSEQILITNWVVNDQNQYAEETSETKSWNIAGYSYAQIIINNTRNYDTAGGSDWLCHNRTIINGTTYNAVQGDKTYTISLSGKTTLTVQLISSAYGGGLSGAYPITCKSIRVY